MATISACGIPGNGLGILAPYRKWLEPDWLYEHRCNLIKMGKTQEAERIGAILDDAFYALHREGLIEDKNFPT